MSIDYLSCVFLYGMLFILLELMQDMMSTGTSQNSSAAVLYRMGYQ